MVNIAGLESEIINVLADIGIETKGYPDTPENYSITASSALLVKYEGSSYSDPQDTYAVVQERVIKFNIMVFYKVSKDSKYSTVYDLVEEIRNLLVGYKPTECSKLYIINDEIVDYSQKMWVYSITIATKTMIFEKAEDDVLVTQITTYDSDGNMETEVESES